ncbi:MAG TPA: hypothetical protein VK886_07660 [Vicinamibacterales bacterium]|nr:hypothetical protein [Vicinamibacterales bacterium]
MGRRYPSAVLSLLVCASAATTAAQTTIYLQAGENLQAALNAAQPGDTILLQPGATFTGDFVLPVKSGAEFITVRSAAPDANLPADQERVTPAMAPLFPRLVSGSSAPAVRTAPGAHHWRLQFLELGANHKGYGEILAIGDGGAAQNDLSLVPYAIVIDRVYIHGDPLLGQKRGIALNGRDITIRGSHISDIKAVGQDSQAIGGWNGPGPYLVENNYVEAAGENFLLGGADPSIPGLVAERVVVRRNRFSRPVSWREPIVPAPAGVAATASASGGVLTGGTYAYRIVARRPAGQTNIAQSPASSEVTAVLPAGTVSGSVTVSWEAVPHATGYDVYGRTSGAQTLRWQATGTDFTDSGAAGTVATVPTSAGTKWSVKNVFELKNARTVTVEYNTFEHNWEAGQAGYAIVFTPRNQDGGCTWCVVEDVQFQYNIVRHTAAAINILGYDNEHPSQQTRDILIRHNLLYDVNKTAWGGNGYFLLLGDEPRDIVVDHNTIVHTGTTVVYAYGGTAADPREILGFRFTNNIARHNSYGLWSTFFTYGTAALNGYYPGATVAGNLLASGASSKYPAGNYFYSDFDGQFAAAGADDYHLAADSPLRGAGTDGLNAGADIDGLLAGIAGTPVGVGLPRPPAAPRNVRIGR